MRGKQLISHELLTVRSLIIIDVDTQIELPRNLLTLYMYIYWSALQKDDVTAFRRVSRKLQTLFSDIPFGVFIDVRDAKQIFLNYLYKKKKTNFAVV